MQYTSPGNLIKFDPIINELEITSLNEFDKVSSEILKMFNKTKKDIYINFLLFLVDIKFLELSYKQESIEVAKVISSVQLSAQQQH